MTTSQPQFLAGTPLLPAVFTHKPTGRTLEVRAGVNILGHIAATVHIGSPGIANITPDQAPAVAAAILTAAGCQAVVADGKDLPAVTDVPHSQGHSNCVDIQGRHYCYAIWPDDLVHEELRQLLALYLHRAKPPAYHPDDIDTVAVVLEALGVQGVGAAGPFGVTRTTILDALTKARADRATTTEENPPA